MKSIKSIINRNNKKQRHGYQERYWCGNVGYKCFYNNDIPVDYQEFYFGNGKSEKTFYI